MKSPGFEINDVGFLSHASAKNQFLWFQYHENTPRGIYRYWNYNVNQWANYTWNNTRSDIGGNVNAHVQFKNSMWLHAGEGVNGAAPSYCDNCTRGGPALRQERSTWGWASIEGDPRHAIVPYVNGSWNFGDQGRSHSWNGGPAADFASRRAASPGRVSYNFGHSINASAAERQLRRHRRRHDALHRCAPRSDDQVDDRSPWRDRDAESLAAGVRGSVRDARQLQRLAAGRECSRRALDRSIHAVQRRRSGRVRLQAVSVEHRHSLGVSAGFHALLRLGAGTHAESRSVRR